MRRAGGSMSVIAQELVYEAKSKVDEQNFDFALELSLNFYRCRDTGDITFH